MVGQDRSTQRHPLKIVSIQEGTLRHRLRVIAADHVRWGRWMAFHLFWRERWGVNHKRVQRFWREEGLQRPTPRKRKRAQPADGSERRHRAEPPHQVWTMDFQFDATADGRRHKLLSVMKGVKSPGCCGGGRMPVPKGFSSVEASYARRGIPDWQIQVPPVPMQV